MPVEIPELQPCTVVAMFAPVRSGKSFLMKKLIDRMERSVSWDIGMEFVEADYEHIYANPVSLCERLESNPHYYRVAYHAGTNRQREFELVSSAMWQLHTERWIVIDECLEVCRGNAVHKMMDLSVRSGRKVLLGVLAASQRIAEIDKLLTSSANKIILFNTTEILDLEAIENRWGADVRGKVEVLRPLIFHDVTRIVEQTPECLVYDVPTRNYKIHSLGDIVKSTTQGEEPCQEEDGAGALPTPEA